MDQNSINKLNQLHPKVRTAGLLAYNESVQNTPNGVHPVIDEVYRSMAESNTLYQKGRTTPGEIVSNAKSGQSWHNFGLALDFHLIVNGKDYWPADAAEALANKNWMIVVNTFIKHGFTSGLYFPGKFKDEPHLEMKCGQTLSGLMAKYNAKDFVPGTNFINF